MFWSWVRGIYRCWLSEFLVNFERLVTPQYFQNRTFISNEICDTCWRNSSRAFSTQVKRRYSWATLIKGRRNEVAIGKNRTFLLVYRNFTPDAGLLKSFRFHIWIEHEKLQRTDIVLLKLNNVQCTRSTRKRDAHGYPIRILVLFRCLEQLSISDDHYPFRFG